MSNVITEQLTQAGQQIEHDSFTIVDREAGPHEAYDDAEWQIVRRMIHATADFEFNGLAKFHRDAVAAGIQALVQGAPIGGPAGKSVGFSHFTPKALKHIDICFPVYNDS